MHRHQRPIVAVYYDLVVLLSPREKYYFVTTTTTRRLGRAQTNQTNKQVQGRIMLDTMMVVVRVGARSSLVVGKYLLLRLWIIIGMCAILMMVTNPATSDGNSYLVAQGLHYYPSSPMLKSSVQRPRRGHWSRSTSRATAKVTMDRPATAITMTTTTTSSASAWSDESMLWKLLDPVLHSSIFWSTAIMLSIIFLLFSWEKTIASARSSLPDTLQPVVDSMLVEMGGLGFVGLILSVVVVNGPLGSLIGQLSQQFLGDANILWQSYQFLDTAFFEVAIAFFVIAGITVASVVKQIESIEMVSRAAFDLNGDGVVELGEIAEVLNVESVVVDLDGDGELSQEEMSLALELVQPPSLLDEIFRTEEIAKAEALVVRERLVQTYGIVDDNSFKLENYFVKIFSRNLGDMVELSPLTWLPLIPVVAQGRSIDLSRDIVSASSPNAFGSCGEFISSTGYVAASTFFVALATVWGIWNFWKMVQIKDMLVPTLVRDAAAATTTGSSGGGGSSAVLLPPRYEDDNQMKKFHSSPFPFGIVESIFTSPANRQARNNQEALFGAAGRHGPELYSNSIKLHTWFVVAQLVFYSSQIVARDVAAFGIMFDGSSSSNWNNVLSSVVGSSSTSLLMTSDVVGQPHMLLPELALYGFYCALVVGQLWLVPKTFLDYCLVTSIEELVSADILTEACLFDGQCEISNDTEQQKDELPRRQGEYLAMMTNSTAALAGGAGSATVVVVEASSS